MELEQGGRGALSEAGEPGGVSCLLYSHYIVERLYRDCTETVQRLYRDCTLENGMAGSGGGCRAGLVV